MFLDNYSSHTLCSFDALFATMHIQRATNIYLNFIQLLLHVEYDVPDPVPDCDNRCYSSVSFSNEDNMEKNWKLHFATK